MMKVSVFGILTHPKTSFTDYHILSAISSYPQTVNNDIHEYWSFLLGDLGLSAATQRIFRMGYSGLEVLKKQRQRTETVGNQTGADIKNFITWKHNITLSLKLHSNERERIVVFNLTCGEVTE